MIETTAAVAQPAPTLTVVKRKNLRPERLNMIVGWLNASLSDVANGCNRAVSRSQIHRILRGEVAATPFEKKCLAVAISRLVAEQDSALWFHE